MSIINKALGIRKTYDVEDHISIALYLENFGLIREKYYNNFDYVSIASVLLKDNVSEAFNFYLQSLIIYEKYYPSGHANIAYGINSLSIIFHYQELLDISRFELCSTSVINPKKNVV